MRHVALLWLAACAPVVTQTVPPPERLSSVRCIAVMPFANTSPSTKAGDVVAEMVAGRWQVADGDGVLEPNEVRALLGKALVAPMGSEAPRQYGKTLGVDAVLLGRVGDFGPKPGGSGVAFNSQLVLVESGEVLWEGEVATSREDGAGLEPSTVAMTDSAVDALMDEILEARGGAPGDCPRRVDAFIVKRGPKPKVLAALTPKAAPRPGAAAVASDQTPGDRDPDLVAEPPAEPALVTTPPHDDAGLPPLPDEPQPVLASGGATLARTSPGARPTSGGASTAGGSGSGTTSTAGATTGSGTGPGGPTPVLTSNPRAGAADDLPPLAAEPPSGSSSDLPALPPDDLPPLADSPLPALADAPPKGGGLPPLPDDGLPPLPDSDIPGLPPEVPVDPYAGLPYAPAAPEQVPEVQAKLTAPQKVMMRQLFGGNSVIRRLFKPNSSTPTRNAKKILTDLGHLLQSVPDLRLAIEVHCDTGSVSGSQTLGEKQTQALRRLITQQLGHSAERVLVLGMGNRQPLAKDISKRGRAQNTRIELRRVY